MQSQRHWLSEAANECPEDISAEEEERFQQLLCGRDGERTSSAGVQVRMGERRMQRTLTSKRRRKTSAYSCRKKPLGEPTKPPLQRDALRSWPSPMSARLSSLPWSTTANPLRKLRSTSQRWR